MLFISYIKYAIIMNDLVEKLREYFNQNTDEQIRKDWEKSKEFDEIKPTVEDFIDIQLKYTSTEKLGNRKIG